MRCEQQAKPEDSWPVRLMRSVAMALFVLTALLAPQLAAAQTSSYTVSNTTSGAINDNSCISRTLNVPVASGLTTVGSVTIGITLSHTYRGDLQMRLTAPNGTTTVMFADRVGAANDNFNATLSDATGLSNVSTYGNETDTTSSPSLKSFAPSNTLSSFAGLTATGNWTLQICDLATVDTGTFLRADLTVSPPLPSADLAVTKTDGITTIASGNSTTYTLTVTNNGPSTITGGLLTDAAVSSMVKTGVSCAASAGQCTAGTTPSIAQLEAGYALPTLASGQSYSLTVTATVTAASGSAVNTATIAVPSGYSDPTSSNNSASDSDSITARVAGTPPSLSCPAGSTIHNWDALSWTAGSTNNNYSVSSIGTVNFAITKSGGTWMNLAVLGGQNPALQTTATGGLAVAEQSLSHYIDFASTSDTATTTITLPTAVPGAQFRLFDVDYGASQFADKITVTGSYGGSSVTPTLTNGTANYVIGNTAYGDVVSGDTSSAGNVTVTFSAPVDTITITYGSNSLAPANPTGQSYFLHDITFCKPAASISVSKTSSVVSDPVNNAAYPKAIPGAVVSYCIAITNNGSGTATSVVATDALPSGSTYVAGSMKSGTSCATATTAEDDNAAGADETDPYGASISGTTITATAASLGVNASFALVYNLTVN